MPKVLFLLSSSSVLCLSLDADRIAARRPETSSRLRKMNPLAGESNLNCRGKARNQSHTPEMSSVSESAQHWLLVAPLCDSFFVAVELFDTKSRCRRRRRCRCCWFLRNTIHNFLLLPPSLHSITASASLYHQIPPSDTLTLASIRLPLTRGSSRTIPSSFS